MKNNISIGVLALLIGSFAGWFGYEYFVGVRLTNAVYTESTMYLSESEQLLRKLDSGDRDKAIAQLIESMRTNISLFNEHRDQLCARKGAELCETYYGWVDSAESYLKARED